MTKETSPTEISDDRAAFFLVTLPGLEDLVVNEVKEWFPNFSCEAVYGGVTVRAPLSEGLAMNLVLKIPTRILLRVIHFRCRDFPKFFNKLLDFKWDQWIQSDVTLNVEASSRESRVKIKKRIEETALDAWKKYQKKKKSEPNPKKPQTLYVRFQKDDCTVSLDTSGERLHKRGARQFIGEAPLRETIAAAMIQLTASTEIDNKLIPVEIVDPMMGSGTFLIEAASRDQIIETRHFAFSNFVSQPDSTPKIETARQPISKLIGFEIDSKTLEAARENLKNLDKATKVEIIKEDFFKAKPLKAALGRRWVLVNPPYGERIKINTDRLTYYTDLFQRIAEIANPDRACVLIPSQIVKGKFKLPMGWKVLAKRPFSNGGIGVVGFVFGRNESGAT